jgi:hypothetical protein
VPNFAALNAFLDNREGPLDAMDINKFRLCHTILDAILDPVSEEPQTMKTLCGEEVVFTQGEFGLKMDGTRVDKVIIGGDTVTVVVISKVLGFNQ